MYIHFEAEIYCHASCQFGRVSILGRDTEGKGKGLYLVWWQAKLWPIYFLFGNVSKYIHVSGQPNSGACQHVAYIPSLPDSFQDFATSFCSKWGTQKKDLMTHCRRELMHGVWKFLLDADFIHAYKYKMVVRCVDGIEPQVYPQFLTYSADYPEK